MKDLQKLLDPSFQRNTKNNKNTWKWSFLNPKHKIPFYYMPYSTDDETLIFESRFESGNLDLAIKISNSEYNLVLQNDSLTKGNTQWFYFKVSNTRKNKKITFHILNFVFFHVHELKKSKDGSLYTEGMKIAMFSEKLHTDFGTKWYRSGENLEYIESPYHKVFFELQIIKKDPINAATEEEPKHYYSLTFTYCFEYDNDTVSMAFSQPYTFTDLQNDLKYLESLPHSSRYMTREILCTSISGIPCDLLTITSQLKGKGDLSKRGVILTARVHPGETVSSYMIKGVIDFLLSDDKEAEALRDNFVFKIVPMLNPDGVVQGNYRCSLSGCDLNRRYICPSKALHPSIFHIKKMARQFSKEYPLVLYCDFHGHSKKKNVFMYGNTDEENPEGYRIFPYIMSKICPFFSFKSSRFSVHKSKSSTARITMWKELNLNAVYTIEASFLGPTAKGNDIHFAIEDLMNIGKGLCQALTVYSKMNIQTSQEAANSYSPTKISRTADNTSTNNNISVSSKNSTSVKVFSNHFPKLTKIEKRK